MGDRLQEMNVDEVVADYRGTRLGLETLHEEARSLGERLERLGRGLCADPARLLIGTPDQPFEEASGRLDVVPAHPLPSIEHLVSLTATIRQVTERLEALRERLVLAGRADVVEESGGYYQ